MTAYDPDAQLMVRVRNGDEEAFRELVERHHRSVIRIIHRAIGDAWEAEDLAQRAFLQIYRSAHRYRPSAKFTTWMYTIVNNLVRNEYRRLKRHPSASLENNPHAMHQPDRAPTSNPAHQVAVQELQHRIAAAIESLPPNQRMAVILARYEGLPYEEIAVVLGCTVPAVKSLLHRARETLRSRLQDYL